MSRNYHANDTFVSVPGNTEILIVVRRVTRRKLRPSPIRLEVHRHIAGNGRGTSTLESTIRPLQPTRLLSAGAGRELGAFYIPKLRMRLKTRAANVQGSFPVERKDGENELWLDAWD